MIIYKNLNGDSGVNAYEISGDRIAVRFNDGGLYMYTYRSAGSHNIEAMKTLASQGAGLNTFINRNVRKLYAQKY